MTVSVICPVRNEGPALRQHLRGCLSAVAGMDVEVVVIDNQSTDGCCHGLPGEVLIVRTERLERARGLWRLALRLATGGQLLWLPDVLSNPDGRFRSLLATVALDHGERIPTDGARGNGHLRLIGALKHAGLLTTRARRRQERWARVPVFGHMLSGLAARRLVSVIPATTGNAGVGPSATTPRQHALARTQPLQRCATRLSVIITAFNEGTEVLRTVESVRAHTRSDHEIIVVDDGSTDGSCAGLEALGARVIRHDTRVGVASSRDAGSQAAVGEVFAYLDAHQRVDAGCLDRCAELAAAHGAITCPTCRPLVSRYPASYGANFRLCPDHGFFSAAYRTARPRQEVTRISALRAPGYVIPRSAYRRVGWVAGLRGWGATDFSVSLKAFFTDVDILHVSTTETRHLFRKRFPYETSWEGVWRNHALIARICFDARTWKEYWLPEVFRANLPEDTLRELESPAVTAEHEAFQAEKTRPDREFWRGLLRTPEPPAIA